MSVRVYWHCNSTVAHLPGVKASVLAEAKEIQFRAQTFLAQHRDEGNARITLEKHDTDALVSLEDPGDPRFNNAVAIEFGHFHNYTGEYIPGLYIISAAAGFLN